MAAIPMTDSKCAWPQAHRDRRGAATQKILKPVPERFDEPEHWKREDIWACTKTIGWLSADSSRVASALGRLCEKSPVLADSASRNFPQPGKLVYRGFRDPQENCHFGYGHYVAIQANIPVGPIAA